MAREKVVILGGSRTPIGRFCGSLRHESAPALAAVTIADSLTRSRVPPDSVSEVIIGNVVSAGVGQAPARQAALKAGIPAQAGALTVNMVCGSGLRAVDIAADRIATGACDVCVAGGTESMSQAPFLVPELRRGKKLGDVALIDSVIYDGLRDAPSGLHMGVFADDMARRYGFTRQALDAWAVRSHEKAISSVKQRRDEIVRCVTTDERGGEVIIADDECPRSDTSEAALARLRPAFAPDGLATAGNSSPLNDGAASLVLASESWAKAQGIDGIGHIVATSIVGVAPKDIFLTPALVIRRLLEKTGLTLSQIDRLEVNEAFAAQVLANEVELGWDRERVNVRGGAIALGHPIGASGARILVTLLYELVARGGGRGIAALCLGGGNGIAALVEVK